MPVKRKWRFWVWVQLFGVVSLWNGALGYGDAAVAQPVVQPVVQNDTWEKMNSDDGIEVFRREVPGSPIVAFRGEGVVDATITRVASVILDDDRATEWVDSLENSKVLKMLGARDFLHYSHIGTPFVIKDRDFVVHGKIMADGREGWMKMTLDSVEDPMQPPTDYIRGEIHGFWNLKSIEGGKKTYAIAEMHADPKGTMPRWLVNLFQKAWPHNTIQSLRKQAVKSDIKIIPQVVQVFGEGNAPAVNASANPVSVEKQM
ncbi:START domain-containing protein [Bdellovibrionota bacterium FG-1]